MSDVITKKLIGLLQIDHPPELRSAAALILGEVGDKDPELNAALTSALDDPEPAVRAQAIIAIGKLKIDQTLPKLLARITEGGIESELAAQAAARLGAKGTKALRDLMGKVAPGLRRRIAGAMGAAGTSSAETAAIDALLDSDPGVVDAAVRSLIAEVPSLSKAHRKELADHLLDLLGKTKGSPLPLPSETAVVRLLAGLGDARAERILWDRTEPGHPPELRAVALQALGKSAATPNKDQLKRLFICAADPDFRVAAPALMLLQAAPVNDKALADWLTLFDAADVAVRRLALQKVGDRDTPQVAAALLKQVQHRDRALRDAAMIQLTALEHGRKALTGALLEAASADEAWMLARAAVPYVSSLALPLRERLFKQACEHLEAGDRRADALLFLLREIDARDLRDRLEDRALALRKKKKYEAALVYLRLLIRDPACGVQTRCELAGCALKVSSHDLSSESRAADPALQHFANLLHHHESELEAFLPKGKWLEPADLFYLGFHFAEKERQERKFGSDVLKLLIKRSPTSKLAKDAKSKLRREGLS